MNDYNQLQKELLTESAMVSEETIGDRRVGIFQLSRPITYENRTIPAIELIEPKSGQICPSTFEHVEFVINEDFDSFMQKYPNLTWDTSSASRKEFPHLKLKLDESTQVKFHPQDILEIVRIEKLQK